MIHAHRVIGPVAEQRAAERANAGRSLHTARRLAVELAKQLPRAGHFRSALAFVDEISDRLGKPSVQKWYVWMLLRRAASGDREQARVLLDDAIASFGAMGMLLSLGEAETMRASLD